MVVKYFIVDYCIYMYYITLLAVSVYYKNMLLFFIRQMLTPQKSEKSILCHNFLPGQDVP